MLEPASKPIKHNYFLASGLGSVIAIGKNGDRLEVGIIGREGMTGLPSFSATTVRPTRPSFKWRAPARWVRRAGVTQTLNQLHRKRLIRLSRGRIEIVDRDGLINSANGTYGIPEAMARKDGIAI